MRRRREVLGIAISVVALLSLSYLAVVEEFSPMVRGIIFVAWVMNWAVSRILDGFLGVFLRSSGCCCAVVGECLEWGSVAQG